MKKQLIFIVCLFLLIGCEKDTSETSMRPMLQEKFNGKYELISSFSKTAVDLNNDDIKSTNLLLENELVNSALIEIRIPHKSEKLLNDDEFIFEELWPTENERRFKINNIISDHDSYYDGYFNLIIGKFSKDLKTSTITPYYKIDENNKNTLIEIKSIDFLEDEMIKVIVVRKLYTKNGWVTTEIESLYKRYTIIT